MIMTLNKHLSVLLLILSLTLPLAAAPAAEKSQVPDYSMTPRKDIPAEYTWRVEDLFPNEEAWKKEKARVLKLTEKIGPLAKDWTSSPQKMLALLQLLEDIQLNGIKLYYYVNLQSDADMGDAKFQQMKGEMQMMFVRFRAQLSFMDTDILKLGKQTFDSYVKQEPGLKPHAFGIEQVLRTKDHVLPTDQERIVSLTGLFSGSIRKTAGILNNVDLPAPKVTLSDGKKVTLNVANYSKYRGSKIRADRALVLKSFWDNHRKYENTFSVLFDGAMKQHLFNARVHKYKDCLSAKLFQSNIDPKVYRTLIKQARENLGPLHRYIKLKQELLGLDKFKYEDIYASSVKSVDKVYPYKEAEKIILKSMKVLGKDYVTGLKLAFDNRWIDRYPNKNKQTGAYSGGIYGVHPFIKMNYDGGYDNVSTLAHELGHAMHSYFSNKTQPYAMAQYSSFLAEIASTFNENILISYLLKNEKDDLFKLYILDAYFQQIKGTVYRQAQFAEFELAMHRHVEAGKTLTAKWLDKTYLDLARYYYGHDKGVCEVGDYIRNEWAGVPHFFLNYYVYTYSTGMISSTALAEMVLSDPKAGKDKYLAFLKAGGSRYPLDTLKLAGVDITTDAPYQAAFKRFDYLITEMENIVKRLKKKNKI
jgi:oligoendopeptidase F